MVGVTAERRTSEYGVTTPEDDDSEDTTEREYKGNKDEYTAYYGSDWEDIRRAVLERDGFECQSCGISHIQHKKREDLFGGGLHIHHKTPTKEFDTYDEANALSNLVALCADCHRAEELGRG